MQPSYKIMRGISDDLHNDSKVRQLANMLYGLGELALGRSSVARSSSCNSSEHISIALVIVLKSFRGRAGEASRGAPTSATAAAFIGGVTNCTDPERDRIVGHLRLHGQ